MERFDVSRCSFRKLPPFNNYKEFQDLCDNYNYSLILWLSLTPFIYFLILILEKKCSKNKYKLL